MNIYMACTYEFFYSHKKERIYSYFRTIICDIPDNECKMLNASLRHLVTHVDLGDRCTRCIVSAYNPKRERERDRDR